MLYIIVKNDIKNKMCSIINTHNEYNACLANLTDYENNDNNHVVILKKSKDANTYVEVYKRNYGYISSSKELIYIYQILEIES